MFGFMEPHNWFFMALFVALFLPLAVVVRRMGYWRNAPAFAPVSFYGVIVFIALLATGLDGMAMMFVLGMSLAGLGYIVFLIWTMLIQTTKNPDRHF